MGMNSALKTRQILDLACGVLGIELIAAAQGLDLRDYSAGKGTRAAHAAVRRHVEFLDVDRPLHKDHNAMSARGPRDSTCSRQSNPRWAGWRLTSVLVSQRVAGAGAGKDTHGVSVPGSFFLIPATRSFFISHHPPPGLSAPTAPRCPLCA